MQEYADQLEEFPLWERREEEPDLVWSRRERYRLLGPTRSVRKAYIQECEEAGQKSNANAPRSWYDMAREWGFDAGAQAWDDFNREERRRVEETERLQARKLRRTLLDDAREKAQTLLVTKTKSDLRLAISAIVQLTAEMRREYGDDPAQRIEHINADADTIRVESQGVNPDAF